MARINRDDIDKFHDYGLHIPSRTLYMGSEHVVDESFDESGVEATMAERQIKNLHLLESISKEDITIIMNNPGGDVIHGMAIYDAIKACKSHVTIKVFGSAMSMGSIILQAADLRIISPNARVMIHKGQVAVDGEANTAYRWIEESKKYDEWMTNLYLSKIQQKIPAFKLARLEKMLSTDTILNAAEAIELGLADKLLGQEEESE